MTTDPAAVSSIDLTFLAVYFVVMAALTGLACLAWRGAVTARREAGRCAKLMFDDVLDCREMLKKAEMYANQTENSPEDCREMVRLAAEYANRAELASRSLVPRKPKPRRRKP
jgi:hypothetical protein